MARNGRSRLRTRLQLATPACRIPSRPPPLRKPAGRGGRDRRCGGWGANRQVSGGSGRQGEKPGRRRGRRCGGVRRQADGGSGASAAGGVPGSPRDGGAPGPLAAEGEVTKRGALLRSGRDRPTARTGSRGAEPSGRRWEQVSAIAKQPAMGQQGRSDRAPPPRIPSAGAHEPCGAAAKGASTPGRPKRPPSNAMKHLPPPGGRQDPARRETDTPLASFWPISLRFTLLTSQVMSEQLH